MLERFQKNAVRTEWTFFYFAASQDEFVPPKLLDAIETALTDEEQPDDALSEDSTSSSDSDSAVESEKQPMDQPRLAAGS